MSFKVSQFCKDANMQIDRSSKYHWGKLNNYTIPRLIRELSVEFACSPRVHIGFLPQSKSTHIVCLLDSSFPPMPPMRLLIGLSGLIHGYPQNQAVLDEVLACHIIKKPESLHSVQKCHHISNDMCFHCENTAIKKMISDYVKHLPCISTWYCTTCYYRKGNLKGWMMTERGVCAI